MTLVTSLSPNRDNKAGIIMVMVMFYRVIMRATWVVVKGFGNHRTFFLSEGFLKLSVCKQTSSYCLPTPVDSVPNPPS